ncbi:hypothetical protein IU11_05655 [Cellulosimicrobium sp. MM]|nr:hypothetical protein IU11_05655 [Cellulosimicrobium sp. MM]
MSVEWYDDTVAPSTHAQFHPPSGSRPSRTVRSSPVTSTPSHAPAASVYPLMHQSTSPPQ